jgi:large subunit ribosomal protein L21
LLLQSRLSFISFLLFKNRTFIVTYSIIETGSKQYRVSAGDRLEVERLAVQAGQPVTFERVLLVNNDGKLSVGSPTVAEATVVADVVEHIRGEKKIAFKMKRRKGYHKTIGHRQELTVVKIKEIRAPGVAAPEATSTKQPAATAESQPAADHQSPTS